MGLGFRIRDLGSGKPIPDPKSKVIKTPDPGSRSATLSEFIMDNKRSDFDLVMETSKTWNYNPENHLYKSAVGLCYMK